MSMVSIIIADDSAKLRNIVRGIVKGHNRNIKIDGVVNGRDLVERVLIGKYALVITDNNMPKLTGLEAIEQIRQFDPDIPICMISASDVYSDAISKGVTDYVEKTPRFREELLDVLKKYI